MLDSLRSANPETQFCSVCLNLTINNPCSICADASRARQSIMVVEHPRDVMTKEEIGSYTGVYHVLHGVISPPNGIGPNDIGIQELVERVENGNILEVVIATKPGIEGDATAMFIHRELKPKGVKLTRWTHYP